MKKRGPDKDLPSCAQWPHNVRPAGFYLGAYKPDPGPAGEGEPDAGAGEETAGAGAAANPLAELLDQVLADLAAGEVGRARAAVAAIRARL
jgi:hypothetical protein